MSKKDEGVYFTNEEIQTALSIVSLMDADEKLPGTDRHRWVPQARAVMLKARAGREAQR